MFVWVGIRRFSMGSVSKSASNYLFGMEIPAFNVLQEPIPGKKGNNADLVLQTVSNVQAPICVEGAAQILKINRGNVLIFVGME